MVGETLHFLWSSRGTLTFKISSSQKSFMVVYPLPAKINIVYVFWRHEPMQSKRLNVHHRDSRPGSASLVHLPWWSPEVPHEQRSLSSRVSHHKSVFSYFQSLTHFLSLIFLSKNQSVIISPCAVWSATVSLKQWLVSYKVDRRIEKERCRYRYKPSGYVSKWTCCTHFY